MILIPRGVKLEVPKAQLFPSSGELPLQCGKCGGLKFGAHVAPKGAYAKVSELVCLHCGKNHKVDNLAHIGGAPKLKEG